MAHNPSGVDPSEEQWKKIADLAEAKKAICIFDTAYQVQEHPGPLSVWQLVSWRAMWAMARQYAVKRTSKARQYAVKRAKQDGKSVRAVCGTAARAVLHRSVDCIQS